MHVATILEDRPQNSPTGALNNFSLRTTTRFPMTRIVDFPHFVFVLTLVVLWLSAKIGAGVRKRLGFLQETERHNLEIVLAATLTLLGLIIGFGFSMVVSRYDQRKNYEAEEANAIGTEYVRAGLLPAADATKVQEALRKYLDERVVFYRSQDANELRQTAVRTSQLQASLWSLVEAVAVKQPTPTVALVVSGMNDVLNSQAYTQAAWWNRLPFAAWCLVVAIAIFCNLLVGYTSQGRTQGLLWILPLTVAISFFLIADIDSPRNGLIRVAPQNLISLAQSMHSQ